MTKQERSSGAGMETVSTRPAFTIRGAHCGDKCFPSLNDYHDEIGKHPQAGGRYKKKYMKYAINAIRCDLSGFRTSKPVILHYILAEPRKGHKRDRGNIFGLAQKFIEDALRDCKVIPDDGPQYVVNFTHDFIYTDKEPYIRVEIEEVEP